MLTRILITRHHLSHLSNKQHIPARIVPLPACLTSNTLVNRSSKYKHKNKSNTEKRNGNQRTRKPIDQGRFRRFLQRIESQTVHSENHATLVADHVHNILDQRRESLLWDDGLGLGLFTRWICVWYTFALPTSSIQDASSGKMAVGFGDRAGCFFARWALIDLGMAQTVGAIFWGWSSRQMLWVCRC